MKRYFYSLLLFLSIFPIFCSAQDEFEPRKKRQTVGWIEKVKISPGDLILQAKLDPGSSYSSIYGENIKKLRKSKKLMVSFELSDRYGTSAKISRDILRSEKIKEPDGKQKEYHVISLGMCLGKSYFEDEVRLIDKKHDDYDIKIGRQALEGNVLIDPSAKLSSSPECGEKGKDLGSVETITAEEGSQSQFISEGEDKK
ncbi:MAG: hypothetical protein GYA55_08445 [SAR324 cluster bacterium]|uniref:Retropepsin-like aspartic endopeptidase domain-containing protein n=1 Tax=SAR324 cluster bacterium TaxID=2024889 RepID=A0A7X9FRV7_9DELT|nr:hypothetical protein [SAR324 cluster bacterium]